MGFKKTFESKIIDAVAQEFEDIVTDAVKIAEEAEAAALRGETTVEDAERARRVANTLTARWEECQRDLAELDATDGAEVRQLEQIWEAE